MTDYILRPVRSGDAAAVASHRVQMFQDMGELSSASDALSLEAATREQLQVLIDSGEYFGWLIEAHGRVVAGLGVLLHRLLPRVNDLGLRRQAYVLNVFTEPAHRRRGLSRRLVAHLIAWCAEHGITRIALHASTAGRPVYESLGFLPTNEMRLTVGCGSDALSGAGGSLSRQPHPDQDQ